MESRIDPAGWARKYIELFGNVPYPDEDEIIAEPVPRFARDWAEIDRLYSALPLVAPSYAPVAFLRYELDATSEAYWAPPPPAQTIPWDDMVDDMQRLIVSLCTPRTRAQLAQTARANVRHAIVLPPGWRALCLSHWLHHRKRVLISDAFCLFESGGILHRPELIVGVRTCIGRLGFRIIWDQNRGKPRNRLRVWLYLREDGRYTARVRYGSRKWPNDDQRLHRDTRAGESGAAFFARFLVWPLAGKLRRNHFATVLPWPTVKDFLLDPNRFA